MLQFIPIIGEVLKQVLPDPKARAEAEAKLGQMVLDGQLKEFENKAKIIAAEASSEHWITSAWRPITMLTFLVLVVLDSFGLLAFRLSGEAWTLLQIGLGGYVVGRSAEKIAPKVTEMMRKD